jgi:hypothetical protein
MSKGPPTKIVSRYGKGEMTLVTKVEGDALVEGSKKCGPRIIGFEDFDGPLPSKAMALNTNQSQRFYIRRISTTKKIL